MLAALKRLLGRKSVAPDWSTIETWAYALGYNFKRERAGIGFAIEGSFESTPWRLEAGESQREYIEGPELRLRSEVRDLPDQLQMLVLSRSLLRALEGAAFERFTDPIKTYADDSAPEEMRWLAMMPRLDDAALGPLKHRYGALASAPAAVEAWLGGQFGRQLLHATTTLLGADAPVMLMVNRGRLTLRTELPAIDGGVLSGWIGLFEAALSRLPQASAALR